MFANLKLTLVSVAVGLLTVATGASGAKAPERLSKECIGDAAYKEIQACPGGPKNFDQGKAHSAAFNSAPPPREAVARKDALGSKQPSQEQTAGYRDTRKTRLQARARKLLITEISGLEKLFQGTKKNADDRPQIVRRLAEGYVELETAATRDKITADIAADEAKAKKQKNKYDAAKKDSAQASAILKRARDRAIRYYRIMKRDYPKYSKIDEILYYLAYEYEQAGDLQEARKVYLELIDKAPRSPYVPSAYLAFGELFFQEAMADPSKWALAESAYKQVINYPPPKNKVYGYARYKLAYVYWNSGDYGQAINEFKKVIEYANSYEDLPSAVQLRKAARRDLVPVYAVAGSPQKAYNFFKPLSGDKGGDDKLTLDMLNELGLSYLDTGHYEEAIKLYQDLMSRDRGDRYCLYQTKITGAVQASQSADKPRIRKELEIQLEVKKEFNAQKHDAKAQLECANRTAELLAETAMSWHLEAVGSGGHRGTGDPKTMAHAAYLYQKVVDNFTQEDFAKFTFPRIVKADWPNIYKIKYAMADLLYVQKRWEDCGPAFDAVVAANPNSPEAPEAAYASVLCYQKMYDQAHEGDEARKGRGLGPKGAGKEDRKASEKDDWEKFKPKPFTDMQKGMITAFNRYVCYIKPPQGDKKALEQYVEVKYARARTYFEAQHWEEAALGFRDVALQHGEQDAALYAAQLYLESVNVLGSKSKPPRPSCFDDMAADVPAFLELFCSGAKYEENKEQCDLLTRIQCDVRRLAAEKTVEAADQANTGALEMYKKGADAYLELWNEYGEQQLSSGGESKCGKMDEILYNAAKAYQAARLLAKSIRVRMILLSPKYKLNETELAQKAIYEIGGNYQAIAVYDQAAKYYTQYAEATKYKGEFADQAVSDAVVLNLGLGDEEAAIEGARAFNRNFGRRKPKQAAQIAFAIGAHYGEKEDWKAVTTQLRGAMPLIDKEASLDVKVQAHALLARAAMNQKQNAAKDYGLVVNSWKDPKAAAASIPDQRDLGRALTAVGEALFYFGELKREAAEKVVFPEYKGKGTKDEVLKHIKTKVADWIKKKQPLIVAASNEYKKIVDLQPVPPPQWVIAGGARVGGLWGKFVADFRAAPIPDFMKKDYELRTAYYGALDDASEPIKQQAKGAYNTCLEYSVKYQFFDEYSRSCERWLAENYKAEYHLIDEFSGAPNRVNSVLDEAPNPLLIGGEPFIPKPKEVEKKSKGKDDAKGKKGGE